MLDDATIERPVSLVRENQNSDSDTSINSSSEESGDDSVFNQT
jgi:hypothetical protein